MLYTHMMIHILIVYNKCMLANAAIYIYMLFKLLYTVVVDKGFNSESGAAVVNWLSMSSSGCPLCSAS